MSQEAKLKPYHNTSRPDVFEGHLRSQDRTLAVLLEQAFRIKEEVAASILSAQGSVQTEALSRRLLESHILTITRIVKQLSANMQVLEGHIAQRDSVTTGTTLAVQCMDQKNMVGIGDLRGRVARCDASISKLSADVSSGERRVIQLQQEVIQLRSVVDVLLKETEVKLLRDLSRVEASFAEHSQGQRSSVSDLHSHVKVLETQISGELKELKKETEMLKKWTEEQLHSSVQIHEQSNQRISTQLQDKLLEAESRLADRLHALEARVEQFETQWDKSTIRHADHLKRSESILNKRVASVENSLHQELQLLKQNYDKGFASVRDAIESLKQIGDIKSRLEEEKIQKDIRDICSKVAELSEL
ncbi:protein FAM81B [Sphaeramia orbicularis]|uniref:protein FAM81B n=1 Tax=Sphaeramia orbicularis TaxID=375764 RepID=UPI00117F9C12|nr:protein FAM81B [Sphaeramia orbicularis]